uniref:Coiled-coil domain-containing protein n=1 Tax=Trichobilharzia regenti TaxID=157069 RepID=A0AA85JSP2_TRIRE|nr:unnamed protein product [Trichobilharzia regenti]
MYSKRKEIKEWNEIDMKDERLLKQNSVKEAIQNLSDCIQNLNNSLSEESELLSKSQEDGKDDLITNEYKKKPFTCNIKDMGIPENAWDWQCSNSEYLSTMLSEFIMLDFEFYNQLEVIKKEYESLRLTDEQLWNSDELEMFEYIWDTYRRQILHQRRHYTLDFLSRLFADRNTKEITDLMDHCERVNQLKDRAVTINRVWKKSRDDLSIRIQATLLQISELSNEKRLKTEKYQSQKELCDFLKEQVQRWRKEKLEMSELEEKENAKLKAQQAEAESVKKAKEMAIRKIIKDKIAEHQSRKAAEKQEQAENEAARLKFLRDMHAKQSRIDMARLKEAQDLRLAEIKQKRLLSQLEKIKLSDERESRLEKLRKKVRPNVLPDPNRSMSDTESWRLKTEDHLHNTETSIERQMSNSTATTTTTSNNISNRFESKLYTYTNAQLCADNRTRLTTALYNAGVLDTDYARMVLSSVTPNRQTRKDTITSKEFQEALNDTVHNLF